MNTKPAKGWWYITAVLATILPGCTNPMRRDVARVEPQIGTQGAVRIDPVAQGTVPVMAVGNPQGFAPQQQQLPVGPPAGVAVTPQAPVYNQQVPAMPVAPAPVYNQQAPYSGNSIQFSSPSTGSSFAPAGVPYSAGPMQGAPIASTAPPMANQFVQTGAQATDLGAGFLSNSASQLSFTPSQPPPPTYTPNGIRAPAGQAAPLPEQPKPAPTPLVQPPPPADISKNVSPQTSPANPDVVTVSAETPEKENGAAEKSDEKATETILPGAKSEPEPAQVLPFP